MHFRVALIVLSLALSLCVGYSGRMTGDEDQMAAALRKRALVGFETYYAKQIEELKMFNNSLEAALAARGIKYTEKNEFLTMRDGYQLYTSIFTPILGLRVPCVLERTSYTVAYGPVMALMWLPQGFAFVLQDQRGSGFSQADIYQFWRYDGADSYDTQEYLTSQSWSNRNIFLTGTSSMGNAAIAGLLEYPPWVKAFSPVWYTGNGHPTAYQGGAFRSALVQNWLIAFGFRATLQMVLENEPYSVWWDPITLSGKEDRCLTPARALGGWYDIFQNETIDGFNACQYIGPTPGQHKLVMGPGGHCPVGGYAWPDSVSGIHQDLTLALFLEENGDDVPDDLAERVAETDAITLYIMGPANPTVGGYWTTIPAWPPVTYTTYYLQPDFTLSLTAPTGANNSITYTYDPANPVRTIGGNELFLPCGPRLQEPPNYRKDVLSFTSAAVRTATALLGNVTATLYVSTSAPDTDFTVKVSDVYSNGDTYNLVDGIFRLKWRDSFEKPTLAQPGQVYTVNIHLWKTAYILEPGHAIRVDVSSSNDPRFQKNPNNGLPIDENGPNVIAQNTVYFDRNRPSNVVLPVINIAAIPNNFNP